MGLKLKCYSYLDIFSGRLTQKMKNFELSFKTTFEANIMSPVLTYICPNPPHRRLKSLQCNFLLYRFLWRQSIGKNLQIRTSTPRDSGPPE